MIKCHLKRDATARAIYEARFAHEKPRDVTPWPELSPKAQDIWRKCADAAQGALSRKPRITITAIAERKPFGRTRYAAH